MRRLSRRLVWIAAVMAVTLLAACGKAAQPAGDQAGGQPQSGGSQPSAELPTYVVGTEAAYPPFEYIDEQTNQFGGFDIELMEAIAGEAGFKVEWKNVAWDALFPALHTKQIDLIISAMTITDERARQVQFSDPYFNAGQVIMVRGDATGVDGPEDLVGRKVGVQANTTGQFAVEKIEGMKPEDIVPFESTPDAFNALVTGQVEAVVADLPVVVEFIKNNPDKDVKMAGAPFTVEYYGIAMRKGETELLEKVNRGLAAVKASGKYDELYAKYFGQK